MQTHEIKWSYSGLKDFDNCPRQYHEVKVLKRYTKFPTEQMRYGTEVHKAVEDYVGEGKPLLPNYQKFQRQLDPLVEMEGIKYLIYLKFIIKNMEEVVLDELKVEAKCQQDQPCYCFFNYQHFDLQII